MTNIENKNIISSGFLFYSFPPHSTDIYILLGIDSYKNKWSDFGGCIHDQENEKTCAVREMFEETMGVVKIYETTSKLMNPVKIKKMIQQKQYTFRIGVNVVPRSKMIQKNNNFKHYSSYNIKYPKTKTIVNDLSTKKNMRVCYVKYIPWQPFIAERFRNVYLSLYKLHCRETLPQKIAYYNSLPIFLKTHPAVNVLYKDQEISDISVKTEWLEKKQIMWWSLPRLKQVLKNNGKYKHHLFRYGFLSTLQIILNQFSKLMMVPEVMSI